MSLPCGDFHFHAIHPCTQKSFDFITSSYKHATLIFLSATLECIKPYIEKRINDLYNEKVKNFNPTGLEDLYELYDMKIRKYRFHRDISEHLNVQYFENEDDILQAIKDGGYPGKWLIFVLSKKYGKNLEDELKKITKKI